MATTTLDMFEYANDAAAQAAYPSNDTAQTAVTNQATNNSARAFRYNTDHQKYAQGFKVAESGWISSVTLYLKRTGTIAAGKTMWIYIYSDTGGNPNSAISVKSSVVSAPAIPTSNTAYNFTFSTPLFLTAGVQYHWVLEGDCVLSTSNYIAVRDNTTDVYGDGDYHRWTGAAWAQDARDFQFVIYFINLQDYSDSVQKQQGSYSLEIHAKKTHSLNNTLTRTIGSPINLSGYESIKFKIRCSRTGTNVRIRFRDSGSVWSSFDVAISIGNSWENETWDISGIANANKDAIDRIEASIINADDVNLVFIDDMYGEITAPTAPSNCVSSYVATNDAKCVWDDNSSNETGFRIEVDIDDIGFVFWKNVGAGVTDSGTYTLGANHKIRFRVRAYNAGGDSSWATSGYTYTIPTAPSGINLLWLSQDETVRIAWIDNSAYEQDFDIEKATDGGGYGHLVYDAASPYDDVAPSGNDHRYIYRVRARCPDGRLSGWNTASKYMYSTPSIPTGLGLSWLVQDETVRLAYTKNHPYGDLDIYKETDGGGSAHLAYDVATPYDDTGPAGLDHKYEYKIRARSSQSDDGSYEYSSFTSIEVIYSTPAAPTNCAIALGTINVTWTDNSAYEDGFQVELQLDGGGWNLVETTAAEAEAWGDISQPTGANVKYEYRVRAKIGALYSAYSTSNVIFVKTCSESIALSDSYSRVCSWFRTFIESITLGDTLQKKPAKTFSEAIALSDSLIKTVYKTFTESITLTDIYSRAWSIYRTLTETLNLTDTLIKKPIKTFMESLHLTDTLIKKSAKTFLESITLSDIYSRVWNIYRTFTETLSLTDTVSKKAAKTFLETLHLQDRYTRVVTWYRIFTENVSLTDTVKKVKSNILLLWKKLMNLFDIEG